MKAVKRPAMARRSEATGPSAAGSASGDPPSASSPTTVELRGVPIHFPFKPYDCQVTYMEKVLDALNLSENALLESPTGTGKTLCLLCATLAWQRQQARLLSTQSNDPADSLPTTATSNSSAQRVPTILYATRTHSQLSQVVRELRNTRYRPRHAVLGSRDQMCVNPKVKTAHSTAADVNHNCSKLGKDRKCRFRNQLEGFVAPSNESAQHSQVQSVMDMEDLVAMGTSRKVCPFYYTRSLVADAELILIPYNYLFDKDARESTLAEVPWDNAIVIFDEAHNLESFASESASFDLSSTDIAGCIAEVSRAVNYVQAEPQLAERISVDNLVRLKALFLSFEEHMVHRIASDRSVYSGEYMMEIFRNGASMTHANHVIFLNEVRKVIDLVMEMRSGNSKGTPKLDSFVTCVKRVFGESTEGRCLAKARAYRVYVSPKEKGGRTISYWCFAPSLAMQELSDLNVRSILVTSGTLSPLPSYSMELGLPFPHTVENPHIIGADQIHVRVVGHGVSGKLLNSSYNRREDAEYITELGNTLVSLARVVPGGMLVFFPSYSVLETCIERWGGPSRKFRPNDNGKDKFFQARRRKSAPSAQYAFPRAPDYYASGGDPSTPWKRLLSQKAVILEPKTTSDLADAISEFHKFLGMPKSTGCVLMGVCRGKISEGIDFAHDMCRAVVITGLPFAPFLDPKVKLKREYLDGQRAGQSIKATGDGGFGGDDAAPAKQLPTSLSGAEWYTQQAHRAVNQAIGRVIRNKSDYGAVLLLDSRFGEARNQQGLSKWVRPHVQSDDGFGVAVGSLVRFYKEAQKKAIEMEKVARSKSGVLLEYERDDEQEARLSLASYEESMTKIAVVQNPTSDSAPVANMGCNGISQSYVPPDKVIARMDLKQRESAQNSKASGEAHLSGNSKPLLQRPTNTLEAVYEKTGSSLKRTASTSASNSSSTSAWSNLHAASKEDLSRGTNVEARRVLRDTARNVLPQVSNRDSKPQPKSSAVVFFEKARATTTEDEMKAIKRSVIDMKKHGDRNDVREYIRAARAVLEILVQYENFDNAPEKRGMLAMFLLLLPQAHRDDVKRLCVRMKFDQSQFRQTCIQSMSDEESNSLLDLVFPLLVTIHCDASKTHDAKAYLRECQPILETLMKHERSQQKDEAKPSLTELFLRLVPAHLRTPTQTMIKAFETATNVKRIKNAEKARLGEGGIETVLFSKPSAVILPRPDVGNSAKNEELTPELVEARQAMQASLMQAEHLNRAKRERIEKLLSQKTKVPLSNTYSSSNRSVTTKYGGATLPASEALLESQDQQHAKKARMMTSSQGKNSGNAKERNKKVGSQSPVSDPISRCLREVESDSYVKQASGVGISKRKIQSNVPNGLKCSLCDTSSKKVRHDISF